MSWQSYVDDQLVGTGHVFAAAIVGHGDDSPSDLPIYSTYFPKVTDEEIAAVMKEFDEPGSQDLTGLHLGGKKYVLIQGEPGSETGFGALIRAMTHTGGLTVMKTAKTLIFGISEDPVPIANCSAVVETLGEQLIKDGY